MELWSIKVAGTNREERLRCIEAQLAFATKEFVFVLNEEGEELYRGQGAVNYIPIDKQFKALLIDKEKAPLYITHNHPSGNLDFSLADLDLFFVYTTVAEMRATGNNKTAVLGVLNRPLPYLKMKLNKTLTQTNAMRKGDISQTIFEIWHNETLPIELKNELPLDIKLIEL